MKTLPNPIRDILGEIAPPPTYPRANMRRHSPPLWAIQKLNPMEVFLASEIFRQFKQIEFFKQAPPRLLPPDAKLSRRVL